MFLALIASIAASQGPIAPGCALTFGRVLVLAGRSVTVCVRRDPEGEGYMLRRTLSQGPSQPNTSWALTRNCPSAVPHLTGIESLPLPKPDLSGFGQEAQTIVLDGALYQLSAPALYGGEGGEIHVSSNIGTPLAEWIDSILAALDPCWRSGPDNP